MREQATETRETLHGGSYNDEDAFNFDTDGFDPRKIKVTCPNCECVSAAICSPLTEHVEGGCRWAGCDHREPYTTWKTTCGKCRAEYIFDTYTAQ